MSRALLANCLCILNSSPIKIQEIPMLDWDLSYQYSLIGCHMEAKQLLHTLYGILFFQFEQSIELVKMASSIKGHHMDKF